VAAAVAVVLLVALAVHQLVALAVERALTAPTLQQTQQAVAAVLEHQVLMVVQELFTSGGRYNRGTFCISSK
jgi:membrane-bound inhibitor of C-type lysozyme